MTSERSIFLLHALDCADFVATQLASFDKQLTPLRLAITEHLDSNP